MNASASRWRHAGLLRLFTGVHLHVEARRPPGALDFRPQDLGEAGPVESFDDVEEADRLARLVGLQGTDQAQFETIAMLTPALHCLLHAVFSKDALPGTPGP